MVPPPFFLVGCNLGLQRPHPGPASSCQAVAADSDPLECVADALVVLNMGSGTRQLFLKQCPNAGKCQMSRNYRNL